jgi:hypothetical protein
MGWLWRRLDAKQVGSGGATSRGSPELHLKQKAKSKGLLYIKKKDKKDAKRFRLETF